MIVFKKEINKIVIVTLTTWIASLILLHIQHIESKNRPVKVKKNIAAYSTVSLSLNVLIVLAIALYAVFEVTLASIAGGFVSCKY